MKATLGEASQQNTKVRVFTTAQCGMNHSHDVMMHGELQEQTYTDIRGILQTVKDGTFTRGFVLHKAYVPA